MSSATGWARHGTDAAATSAREAAAAKPSLQVAVGIMRLKVMDEDRRVKSRVTARLPPRR
jgi:hypothetical protein